MTQAIMSGQVDEIADDLIERSHRFSDLSAYPFKQRCSIRAIDLTFYGLINVIGRTVKFEVEGWQHWEAATANNHVPIYTFWHDCIFLSTFFWRRRGIVVLTSQSYDGEYIARFIQRFGYGAARGSSTRGSVGAVIEMIRLMRQRQPAAVTIDGPQGPRHVAKMGSVLLAKKTGNPILPFSITSTRYWSLKSWDALTLPKPFSRAKLEIAEPIFVPPDADEALMEAKRCEMQSALDKLECRGQVWRAARLGRG